ncbi:MAG TPA: MqnA/MqnD/SBP family protein [Tepidisphaeraceae bacterium]|nr:MqnA/MqnD/SBP family protein [Tepidisphaeraceae bacterium]
MSLRPKPDPLDRITLRLGSVSFVNARPLIYGLEQRPDVRLTLDVPANLLDGLRASRFDLALLPVIDYQRMEGLQVLPAAGIGSDGQTLTVRIFSRTPIERISTLACDADSHTSVALARIVLARAYGLRPEFVELKRNRGAGAGHDAQLLIGDKVVCESPAGYPHQLDMGAAWKDLTGMPFVFAAWMGPAAAISAFADETLRRAKRQGLAHVDEIVQRYAVPRGWPAETAREYLTRHLQFDIGEPQLEAIRAFHRFAAEEGIIPNPPRALAVWQSPV